MTIIARIHNAWRVLLGRAVAYEHLADADLHSFLDRLTKLKEFHMAAIDDLNAVVADVTAYVSTLKNDLANADQTPAIEAATTALKAVLPAPAPAA